MANPLEVDLLQARARLARGGLLGGPDAILSLRIPGADAILVLAPDAPGALQMNFRGATASAGAIGLHARIYRVRADVGAVATAGGPFTRELAGDEQSTLAPVFDEQVRHLGPFPARRPDASPESLRRALATGTNCLACLSLPLCLGVNCRRMVFNVELFEKCAKAYLLANATGARPTVVPWWVRRIANGRLAREEERAAARFALGLVPEDAKAY